MNNQQPEKAIPEHPAMPCCAKCGAILIGIWETDAKSCSGECRGHSRLFYNPNAHAIKVIKERIDELKHECYETDTPFKPAYYNNRISELNHILKLLEQ